MPKFNTVNSKLVLSMSFVLVVCFVIYLVIEGNIAKNSVLKNEYENYKNRLESTQTLIDVYINEKTNVINELQKDIAKNLEDENLISTKLALGKDLGGFSLTYLGVEDTGRMIRSNFNNQSPSDGYEPRTRDWYSKTKSAGKDIILGEVWIQASTQTASVGASSILMQNGKLYGVVSGGLELATLNEYFKSLQDNYNYSIVAMDLTHNIVLSKDSNDIGKQTDLSKALIEGNKQNNDGFIRFEYDGISNIALCSVNNKTNWLVCFVEDASIIDSAMSSRIFELAISLVILMVVLLILLNILVRLPQRI